jgi:predicted NUDIX family NTP pyrophosphohydrolase
MEEHGMHIQRRAGKQMLVRVVTSFLMEAPVDLWISPFTRLSASFTTRGVFSWPVSSGPVKCFSHVIRPGTLAYNNYRTIALQTRFDTI